MNEIATGTTVRIFLQPIVGRPGATRRQSEQEAVSAVLSAVLGPGARITHEESGAPQIASESPAGPLPSPANRSDLSDTLPEISISHSTATAAIALAPRGTVFGIDIEAPREQLRRVASRLISPDDRLPDLDLFTLLRLWTAKEAVYKALRATALPLGAIAVDLPAMRATALGRSFALSHYPLRGQLLTLARRL